MTSVVLDASALLAMLLGEPGSEKVKASLDGAVLGVVAWRCRSGKAFPL